MRKGGGRTKGMGERDRETEGDRERHRDRQRQRQRNHAEYQTLETFTSDPPRPICARHGS